MLSYVAFFVLIFDVLLLCEGKYAYILWEKEMSIHLTDFFIDIPEIRVAQASYSNEINTTGWAFLELRTFDSFSDDKQAYAAGYIEGYLTRDLIWWHWQNMLKGYCYNKIDVCGRIEEFLDKNDYFIHKQTSKNVDDPYWYQMRLYYMQIEGLAVGYNAATKDPYQFLTTRDIIWINMLGDLDDLAIAVSTPRVDPDGFLFPDHCTGLIKLLPNLANLYFSHVTWNSYQSMLRIQKKYVMPLRKIRNSTRRIPGHTMAFTSYPAFVQSTDDFYILSSGLAASETTIGNSNQTLVELIHPDGQILEFARSMVANRLARTGEEWVNIFQKHNSGTYNNQWFILDYNKFTPTTARARGSVRPGLLWVLEQLPGYIETADITDLLVKTSYYPSYNIPFFPRIFNLSGGNVRVATFGDWFGYHTNPRARILKDKQEKIASLRDMFYVMRYNDYKYDPYARCDACKPPYSACNAIAARNDLNPANGTYPFRALGHRSHGATDAKLTSAFLRKDYRFLSVSGPTHNIARGIPPFDWTEFDLGKYLSHVGHPNQWLFQPLIHEWEWV